MKKIIAMIVLTIALGACTTNEELPDESVLERYARGLQKRYNLKVNTEGDKGKANDICSKTKVIENVSITIDIHKQSYYHVIEIYDNKDKFSFSTTKNALAYEICQDLEALKPN